MELYGYYLLEEAVTSSLLILMYLLVLWHNFRGSKFTFVYLLVSCFLVANCFLLANSESSYVVDIKREVTAFYVWDWGVSIGGTDLGLCVSHLLLAFKYREIAHEAPYAAEGVQYPAAKRRRERILFWILLPLNVIFPICESILTSVCKIDHRLYSVKPTKALIDYLNSVILMIGALQIVSGYFILRSVFKIKAYIERTQQGQGLNIRTMLIHASAFGFYLFSVVIFYGTFVLDVLYPDDHLLINNRAMLGATIFYAASFISQALFGVVLWQLGTVEEPEPTDDEDDYASVIEEDFTEDDELQARIWNQFLRNNNTQESTVTSRSIAATRVNRLTSPRNQPFDSEPNCTTEINY